MKRNDTWLKRPSSGSEDPSEALTHEADDIGDARVVLVSASEGTTRAMGVSLEADSRTTSAGPIRGTPHWAAANQRAAHTSVAKERPTGDRPYQ